jgi:pimeloyl-ACP methyl ester carboxylesterase
MAPTTRTEMWRAADVNDRIEARRYGSRGPVVAVLHGGPGAAGSVAGLAMPLGDGFRVLEPMQRHADGVAPLTVARHVEDLAGVLDEPTLVVGWSWGAMLGLSFAAAHPELVRALVLVGCGTYDEASRAEYQRRFAANLGADGVVEMDRLRAQLAAASSDAERDAATAVRGERAELAQAYDLLAEPPDAPPTTVDARGHTETWDDVLRLQADGAEPAAFAAITAPVLMLHGDTDPHPGPGTRDLLRAHIPQLEYVELLRCGHTPWKERHARDAFFTTLRAWLHAHA